MKITATMALLGSLLFLSPDARAQFSQFNGTDYQVGSGPFQSVFADFDGDGDEDLAVTNSDSNNVSVLENTPGGFDAVTGSPFSVGSAPGGIVAADVDGDGDIDLATANEADPGDSDDGNVTVLINDGSAAFTSQTVPNDETGADPYGIVAGDFDGDTDVDLALTNRIDAGKVTVLGNDGSGTFTRADQISVGTQPRFIAAGDFDGDGLTDLASANNGPPTTDDDDVSILENTTPTGGLLSFNNVDTVTVEDGPNGIVADELTGDGETDLAVTNGFSNSVSILENTSSTPGSFSFSETTEGVGANPFGITSGEFNGEMGTDLAVVNNDDNDVAFLLNDGAGNFTRFGSDQAVGSLPFGVAGAEINDDGLTDLAVANFADDDVSVLRSDEEGLPVELAGDFSGVADGGGVVLTWSTLSEESNDHFRLMQEQDGSFVEVGVEASKAIGGSTNEAQQYRHRVEEVTPGRHVFHLLQVDLDGTEHFGAETTVEVDMEGAYRLTSAYPNPFHDVAQFSLTVQQQQSVRVGVYDVLGRRVQVLHDGPLASGERKTLRFEGASLSSGTYLIRITGGTFSAVRKVTLVR